MRFATPGKVSVVRLLIQIPCYNEAGTLRATIGDLPRVLDGVDIVEWLVIDDGSSDDTAEVARSLGVDHIVRHTRNRGLAAAFRSGIDACLQLGADIIVNTDGDNQYCADDIPKLVAPVLEQQADIVVGDRQTDTIEHFSITKKMLQRWGSSVVRRLAAVEIPDTVSGFRAFSRDAAIQLNIVSPFSYTIETLIQAGSHRLAVASVPVRTNSVTRESRLFRSTPSFLANSASTIVRMYSMYYPLQVFVAIGAVPLLIGLAAIGRFLYLFLTGDSSGHVQSLVLGGSSVVLGVLILLIGLIADLISANRRLLEMCLTRLRVLECELEERNMSKQPQMSFDNH